MISRFTELIVKTTIAAIMIWAAMMWVIQKEITRFDVKVLLVISTLIIIVYARNKFLDYMHKRGK